MRRALSSTFVCVALLTAGCAAKGPESPAAAAQATAPTKAAAATAEADHTRTVRAAVEGLTTARTAYRWEVGMPGSRTYALTGKGGHDFARKQGTLVVSLEDAARFEQVFTPQRLYVRGTTTTESADWMFVDRAGLKTERILKAPGNDPECLLRQVELGERYQRLTVDDVAGVSATRYRGELTQAALTLNMTTEARKKADQMRDMLGGTIPATADVWIDEQGRLVQLQLKMDIEGTILSTTTLTLTGQGEPVKVRVPADAAEADTSSLV
jgi:predicted small lipoprotein YifL